MTTKIYIEDLKIYAFHGVLPEENLIGTYYLINVEVQTDFSKALASDNLGDTVSYALIHDIIQVEMKEKSKLMEHVCGRIINSIQQNIPEITYIKIKMTKLNPPMRGEMKGASVEVEKSF